jgi:hypothetical protein
MYFRLSIQHLQASLAKVQLIEKLCDLCGSVALWLNCYI